MTVVDEELRVTGARVSHAGFYRRAAVVILLGMCSLAYVHLQGFFVGLDKHGRPPNRLAQWQDLLVVLGAGVVCWPMRRVIAAGLDLVRRPTVKVRRIVTLCVWAAVTGYCWWTMVRQGNDLSVRNGDEMMYLTQTHQVAGGHFWLPAHPLADFFQTFYIFAKPVYAAMHFPGAAMMFAPSVWLGIAPQYWALLIAGAVAGMTYRVVTELSDGVGGILAVIFLVSMTRFRSLSIMALSYLPMALLILLITWAYLHWRRGRRLGWAAVVGGLVGFAMLTRPLDAMPFAACFAVAILWDLRGAGWRRAGMTVAVGVLTVLPFVALQLSINKGVTGDYRRTPVQMYFKTFFPGIEMNGLSFKVTARRPVMPAGVPPEFESSFHQFLKPLILRNDQSRSVVGRYVQTLRWGAPSSIFVFLWPLALVGLFTDVRRAAWVMGVVIFPVAYLTFLYHHHYVVVIAPGLAFMAVLGAREVAAAFPRQAVFLGGWLTVAIAAIAVSRLPEVTKVNDHSTRNPVMQAYNRAAATMDKPAVVFFRTYPRPKGLWRADQTHNFESAAIDEAKVVRARYLGDRNQELIDYYGKLQPGRTVYVFDQRARTLTKVGKAGELAGGRHAG